MATLQDLLAMAAARGRLFGATMRYTELTDIAAGGSIGSAASTVDLYPFIAINQTTANKVLTLPTPTNTSVGRGLFVANTGTAGFFMYGRFIRPGGCHEFVYVPSVGWRRTSSSPQIIAQSSVAVTAPADTNENTLATVVIPGGVIGSNGRLRISIGTALTNNANSKTWRVKFGGTTFTAVAQTSVAQGAVTVEIYNRNSEAAQFGRAMNQVNSSLSTAFATATADTTADQSIVITAQKATGTDTMTLESYAVELMRID